MKTNEHQMDKISSEKVSTPLYQGNFLKELRGADTFNTAPLVSVNDANAKSLLLRHTKDGFVAFSINTLCGQECVHLIRNAGFSFIPIYVGRVESVGTNKQVGNFQCTFLVFPRDKQGVPLPFEELKKFAISLANKYNQDDVLIVAPGETLTTDVTFDDVEYYINPAPQCLSEAHTRYLSGEICLRYK